MGVQMTIPAAAPAREADLGRSSVFRLVLRLPIGGEITK